MVRRWRDLSVGRKVVLPYVILTLAVGLLVSAVASQQIAAQNGQQTSSLANREQVNVNTVISSLEDRQLGELRLLTATTGVGAAVENDDSATLIRLLLPLTTNELPQRLQVAVITRDGQQLVGLQADPNQIGKCICDLRIVRPTFAHLSDVLGGRADKFGSRYVGLARQGDAWQVYTVGPVLDSSGVLAGAVAVSEPIDEILADVEQRAEVEMALFGTDGSPLGATRGMQYRVPALGAADRRTAIGGHAPIVRAVSRGANQGEIFYVPWMMRNQPMGYIGLEVPTNPVSAFQARLTFVILAICVAALIVTLVLGWFVARSITHPMAALLTATNEVASGRLDYRARVDATDEIGRLTVSFNEMIQAMLERTDRLERFSEETLLALAAAIDARDHYTLGHSVRVAAYSHLLARSAGLQPDEIDAIRRGCLVHDIGKIGVPDKILRKEGRLNRFEEAQMRAHPVIGHKMISRLDWDAKVFDVVLHHHERWDGDGYPGQLKSDAIPVVARVVAIADTLDAMTSVRPYRDRLTFGSAMDEISRQAGIQFDPMLARVLRKVRRDVSQLGRMLGRNEQGLDTDVSLGTRAAEAGAAS